jgi:hypothetical protein
VRSGGLQAIILWTEEGPMDQLALLPDSPERQRLGSNY